MVKLAYFVVFLARNMYTLAWANNTSLPKIPITWYTCLQSSRRHIPKSLAEKSGGFDSVSTSSSTICHQNIDGVRQIQRPNTPSQGSLSSPYLPGCYQKRVLSSRIQSPIMRNSSYLDHSKYHRCC